MWRRAKIAAKLSTFPDRYHVSLEHLKTHCSFAKAGLPTMRYGFTYCFTIVLFPLFSGLIEEIF
jgi:hypothetical protein